MMTPMWEIKGYDSAREIFADEVPGSMSVDEVSAILERLVCRDLTPDKIVSASVRKNYKRYVPLLEVHIDRMAEKGTNITAGENPHYVALRKRIRPMQIEAPSSE
jgi:hypothetical protein